MTSSKRLPVSAIRPFRLLLRVACLCGALLAASAAASAAPPKLDKVNIYVILNDDSRVIGELSGFDARQIQVRERTGRVVAVRWDQIKPMTCYYLQKRLTDPNSAEANFRLGVYCREHGLQKDSQAHFSLARRLDPAYAERIKAVATGAYHGRVGLAIELSDPKELAELEAMEQQGRHGDAPGEPVGRPGEVVKFQRFSAETQRQALEQIRTFGRKANEKLSTKLAPVETEHFAIFTDWPGAEQRKLGAMFERIYDRLSRQFDIPLNDNIFLGKMPIFAFAGKDDYVRFARDIDRFAAMQAGTIAYVRSNMAGYQHMNLFRYSNQLLLEKVATHECVHAFVNRYRTNIPLEGWVNEGLAEVMSGAIVPRARTLERARQITRDALKRTVDYDKFMHGYGSPPGGYYPICTTMVDYLVRRDPARFLAMVDRIKGGMKTEAAMQAAYGMSYEQFRNAWRKWAAGGFPDLSWLPSLPSLPGRGGEGLPVPGRLAAAPRPALRRAA